MRKNTLVAVSIGLLLVALAGMEWMAERQWYAQEAPHPAEVADSGLPEVRDLDDSGALASPHFVR